MKQKNIILKDLHDLITGIKHGLKIYPIFVIILFGGGFLFMEGVVTTNQDSRYIAHSIQLELDFYFKEYGEYPSSFEVFDHLNSVGRRDIKNMIETEAMNTVSYKSLAIEYQPSVLNDSYEILVEQRLKKSYIAKSN